jgi:hypothetical protein
MATANVSLKLFTQGTYTTPWLYRVHVYNELYVAILSIRDVPKLRFVSSSGGSSEAAVSTRHRNVLCI